MDNKLEKLIATIMKECEADGEPVSYEEAKDMAEMEIRANKDCKTYAQSAEKRKPAQKERKVDEEKKKIISCIKVLIEGMQLNHKESVETALNNETELSFTLSGNSYTIKLIKHRPPKKQAVARGNSSAGRALDF